MQNGTRVPLDVEFCESLVALSDLEKFDYNCVHRLELSRTCKEIHYNYETLVKTNFLSKGVPSKAKRTPIKAEHFSKLQRRKRLSYHKGVFLSKLRSERTKDLIQKDFLSKLRSRGKSSDDRPRGGVCSFHENGVFQVSYDMNGRRY